MIDGHSVRRQSSHGARAVEKLDPLRHVPELVDGEPGEEEGEDDDDDDENNDDDHRDGSTSLNGATRRKEGASKRACGENEQEKVAWEGRKDR